MFLNSTKLMVAYQRGSLTVERRRGTANLCWAVARLCLAVAWLCLAVFSCAWLCSAVLGCDRAALCCVEAVIF